MPLFDQLYNRLFKDHSEAAPILYEPLVRNDRFLDHYNIWRSDGSSAQLLKNISTSYALKQNDLMGTPDVHILKGSSANGIAISYDPGMDRNELSFLKEYLKDEIKKLGYKQANADRIIKEKGKSSETTEKYYLKPIITGEQPFDQLYGNVLIEQVLINDQPSYLKFVVSTYHDSNYQPAYPFSQLIEKILNP